MTIEFFPEGATEALLATVKFSGVTELKFDQRMVVVTDPLVQEVNFSGGDFAKYSRLIKQDVRRERLEIPLDSFLAYLADDVLSGNVPAGFNTDAPPIHIVESPSYPVTHVNVVSSSPSTVTYYYYPYYPSYGHGNYYNPATGTYGSRSVFYGPYGGYTYNEAYNPQTGRYGYVETGWDGGEWRSYGETHNERTGVSTETKRYYSDDKDRMTTNRRIEGDDGWMKTERTVDDNDRWSETNRKTSEGGRSEVRRDWDEQGNLSSSGTINAADGRTATVQGDYSAGQGSTTISGSEGGGGTLSRSVDGSTVSRESSLNSVASGRNRATVAESASGDLYAGHNGSVYKKSGDDWQHYDGGSGQWQQSGRDTQAGSGRYTGNASTGNNSLGNYRKDPARPATSTHDYNQLNRDARASLTSASQWAAGAGDIPAALEGVAGASGMTPIEYRNMAQTYL